MFKFEYWIEIVSNGQTYFVVDPDKVDDKFMWTLDYSKRMIWDNRHKAAGYFLDIVEVVSCEQMRLVFRES